MVEELDHIAVCVWDARQSALDLSRILGVPAGDVRELPEHGVLMATLAIGDVKLELVQPTDPNGSMARFLDRRGEGLHHICFRVQKLSAALQRIGDLGLAPIQGTPGKGANGDPVAFLHPKDTHGILIELVEKG